MYMFRMGYKEIYQDNVKPALEKASEYARALSSLPTLEGEEYEKVRDIIFDPGNDGVKDLRAQFFVGELYQLLNRAVNIGGIDRTTIDIWNLIVRTFEDPEYWARQFGGNLESQEAQNLLCVTYVLEEFKKFIKIPAHKNGRN